MENKDGGAISRDDVTREKQKRQVPNLEIDAKKNFVSQTKEVPLIVNGEETKITLRKLTTAERNKVTKECTNVKVVGGQQIVKVDHTAVQIKILSKAIIEAPFEINENILNKLPVEVGDYLFEEYNKFARPTVKKKD